MTAYFGKPKQVWQTALKPTALLEEERLGTMRIVRWPEVSGKRRQRIMKAGMEVILEKELPDKDTEMARYMRRSVRRAGRWPRRKTGGRKNESAQ